MSTQSPIYIMWGLMLPEQSDDVYELCDPYLDSAYDKEPKPGVTVLWGEEFVAIGHVLARSDEYGSDLGVHSIPPSPIIPGGARASNLIQNYSRWRNEIEEALKAIGLDVAALGSMYQWHVIQHYR